MKKLFCILILTASAFGNTTVTGNLKNLGTGSVTSSSGAFVRFWLRGCRGNQPRITGAGAIAPQFSGNTFYFDIAADGSGNVSGTLYSTRDAAGTGDGDIECGGSHTAVWYGMQVINGSIAGPEVPIHAKSGSTIDVSNVSPITTPPVTVAADGDNTYLQLSGGNSPVTGLTSFTTGINTKKQNGVLHVGPSAYASIAAAEADAGTVNKTVIVIDSTYTGVDCPSHSSNRTVLDYRGNPAINCTENTTAFNGNDGTVNAMIKEQMTVDSVAASGSAVARWSLAYLMNGTGGSTLDAVSTEAVTLGTLTGTLDHMTGNESVSLVQSTGGTITEVSGIQGYIADTNTRTSAITTASGLIGIGCFNMTGTPKPVNCYGVDAFDQTNQGSGRNYSIFLRSRGLLGYSDFASNGGLDMEDSSHNVHTFLYTTGTDANIRAIGAGGLNLIDNAGSTQARVLTTGLTVSNHLITPDVKIGTSGTVLTDSRNLVQYSTTLSTAAVTSEGVSMPGVTTGSKCAISPTNATAATNIATTYISAKNADSVTVTHTATAGMTYDILCTAN